MAMIGNGMFSQELEECFHFDRVKDDSERSVKSIRGEGMIIPVSVDKIRRKKMFDLNLRARLNCE